MSDLDKVRNLCQSIRGAEGTADPYMCGIVDLLRHAQTPERMKTTVTGDIGLEERLLDHFIPVRLYIS